MSGTQYTAQDFRNAKSDQVLLAEPGHAALARAALRLGRPRRADRAAVRPGRDDLRGTRARRPAHHDDPRPAPPEDRREVGQGRRARAAPGQRAPGRRPPRRSASTATRTWIRNLEGKNLRNGALVAMDYQTGELVAYVGVGQVLRDEEPSGVPAAVRRRRPGLPPAGLGIQAVQLRDRHRRRHAHGRVDVHGQSPRTSAAATRPSDADNLERGPVRVRNALQFSLNIPSVKAMAINKPDHVFDRAKDFGMNFQQDKTDAGLALALGVAEVRPVDLVTAYATLANGGKKIGHTTILAIKDTSGKDVEEPYVPPAGEQVDQAPVGVHRDRHPGRQHEPERQPVLGQVRHPRRGRPPARDAQDRHEQRRQGPQRLRLHRAADREGPRRRRLRARRRRLERQQRQHAGLDGSTPRLLDRRLDVRLAGLPPGGQPQVAGDPVRAPAKA